jgi:hypothetical protein
MDKTYGTAILPTARLAVTLRYLIVGSLSLD